MTLDKCLGMETLISETEIRAFIAPSHYESWYTNLKFWALRIATPIPANSIVQMSDEGNQRQLLTDIVTDIAYIFHHQSH